MGSIVLIIVGVLIGKFLLPNKTEVDVDDIDYKDLKKIIEEKNDLLNSQKIQIEELLNENSELKEKYK